jgi:RNA polymerase sigma-70 factor (ECF subfamily)
LRRKGTTTTNVKVVMWSARGLSVDEQGAAKAEAMYRQHYQAVMRYVRARVATQELAEDLVSDVFCRALAAMSSYQQLRPTALPWLYTIAAHRVADYYRSRRTTCPIEAVEAVSDRTKGPEELVAEREALREVWKASQVLPDSQRRALWFRYGEELELREIAVRMGRSVEAVKLLLHRAIRGVRRALESTGPQPATASRRRDSPRRGMVVDSSSRLESAAGLCGLMDDLEAA